MADQGVKYVVTLQDINVTSGLTSMERSAMSAEASIASLNGALGALGIGIGLKRLIQTGKEWVQGAADYEVAVKRIKFASIDLADAGRNLTFISGEADKFKIPLQSATEAYGNFLAMMKGSDLAGEQVRKLHDELLLIGKVKGLGDGQLDAAVRNVGKMLESGSLDARHFRPLEQQLSGIGKFVADELGISVHQLAILRNKGKMSQIDPTVMLEAIRKMAKSLEQFLPESTTTIQSQLNDLDTAWLRFKNDLVFDNVNELKELFYTLKDGVGWLKEHEKGLESFGKTVLFVAKYWLEWKVVTGIIKGVDVAYQAFTGWYLGNSAQVVSATTAQATSMNALALSMERVAYAAEVLAGASLSGVVGLGALGIPLANAGAAAAGTGVAAGAAGGSLLSKAIPVIITYFAVDALSQLGSNRGTKGYEFNWWNVFGMATSAMETGMKHELSEIQKQINKSGSKNIYESITGSEDYKSWRNSWGRKDFEGMIPKDSNGMPDHSDATLREILKAKGIVFKDQMFGSMVHSLSDAADVMSGKKPTANKAAGADRVAPPTDKITGQRVISYNINIKEINGIKQNTVEAGANFNPDDVAEKMAEVIEAILNDSQIKAGG